MLLIDQLGLEGYGIYFMLLETLRDQHDLRYPIEDLDLLADETGIFKSKGETRRLIKENGLTINLEKISDPETIINDSWLINGEYIVVRQGKKNYSIIKPE